MKYFSILIFSIILNLKSIIREILKVIEVMSNSSRVGKMPQKKQLNTLQKLLLKSGFSYGTKLAIPLATAAPRAMPIPPIRTPIKTRLEY